MWNLRITEVDTTANIVVAIAALIFLAIVGLLWFFPVFVANKLLSNVESENRLTLPFEQVQAVGFCLLGLWIIATAIPSTVFWTVMSYHAAKPGAVLSLDTREFASMTAVGVQLIIGTWLLFGAKGLRGILRWARTAGS
jgi:uncharacterized protein YqhQ